MKTGTRGIIKKAPGKPFYTAAEVESLLGVSRAMSYRIIRGLRDELISEGKLSEVYPKGKIPKSYFNEKCMIS